MQALQQLVKRGALTQKMIMNCAKVQPMTLMTQHKVSSFGGGGHALRPAQEGGRIKVADHM